MFSYEANPDLEPVIRRNFRLNGWTPDLTMRAVTSDGRDLPFFRSSNVISSSVVDRNLAGDEIVVESLAINDLIDEHRPSVVVMDVEGGEVDLLSTADLSRVRTLIVEMHPHIVGKEKITMLVGNIEAKGFRLADVCHKTCFFRIRNDGHVACPRHQPCTEYGAAREQRRAARKAVHPV